MSGIDLPLNWSPRTYQLPLWKALETGTKRAVAVWHRRAGKDLVSVNWTIVQAFQRVGLYWHVLPTYKQGRKIVWEGMTKDGRRFMDHWPNEAISRRRDDEMTQWLSNGSVWQVVGAENEEDVNKLVGANPVGVVFSEYALQVPAIWNFVRPILAENGGWALFIYTPRGRNHGYTLAKMAEKNERWFFEKLSVDDTNAIPMEAIENDREEGMPEEMVQQEYFVSFDAPLVGSYYGEVMAWLAQEKRISNVPWEPELPVYTAWDLGIGDATTIWYCQQVRKEVRIIDYDQGVGKGLEHYTKLVSEKPYTYADHLVPHDAKVREFGTGKTRVEMAKNLGIKMRVVQKISLEDGIAATRALLRRCWIDETKCETGIQALREYRKEWDPVAEIFRNKPRHDWTSHPADGFRTLAVGLKAPREKRERLSPHLAIA